MRRRSPRQRCTVRGLRGFVREDSRRSARGLFGEMEPGELGERSAAVMDKSGARRAGEVTSCPPYDPAAP
ncbi:hypothetical protein NDU88_005773 [Pleurodeles waltl]|uniref:Uncharacterized protein n=1 Tax=Pleurodeles waltl TaxID=8319 RepID=A0AAV7MYZ3_PLEWA|nr:hypothetical protein NDU88_005773 [Pleurodeles waltl]